VTSFISRSPAEKPERKVHQNSKQDPGLLPGGEDVLLQEENHEDAKEKPQYEAVHHVRIDQPVRICTCGEKGSTAGAGEPSKVRSKSFPLTLILLVL